jgi:hypothetical protein
MVILNYCKSCPLKTDPLAECSGPTFCAKAKKEFPPYLVVRLYHSTCGQFLGWSTYPIRTEVQNPLCGCKGRVFTTTVAKSKY